MMEREEAIKFLDSYIMIGRVTVAAMGGSAKDIAVKTFDAIEVILMR